jgi:hypothetical protein
MSALCASEATSNYKAACVYTQLEMSICTYIASQFVAVLTLYGMYAILKVPAVLLAHIATARDAPCLNLTYALLAM